MKIKRLTLIKTDFVSRRRGFLHLSGVGRNARKFLHQTIMRIQKEQKVSKFI